MSPKLIKLWGHCERPWGYEVRAIFQDENEGIEYNECLTWMGKVESGTMVKVPAVTQEMIDEEVNLRRLMLEERILKLAEQVEQEMVAGK